MCVCVCVLCVIDTWEDNVIVLFVAAFGGVERVKTRLLCTSVVFSKYHSRGCFPPACKHIEVVIGNIIGCGVLTSCCSGSPGCVLLASLT